ncbi:hypothetical protein EDB85DRAFT_1889465 [Lactarius pseudohatsudake]|nr:hypothetical protein EDB85DRAFT_1889465 [Lactarius pseudohatsudake]
MQREWSRKVQEITGKHKGKSGKAQESMSVFLIHSGQHRADGQQRPLGPAPLALSWTVVAGDDLNAKVADDLQLEQCSNACVRGTGKELKEWLQVLSTHTLCRSVAWHKVYASRASAGSHGRSPVTCWEECMSGGGRVQRVHIAKHGTMSNVEIDKPAASSSLPSTRNLDSLGGVTKGVTVERTVFRLSAVHGHCGHGVCELVCRKPAYKHGASERLQKTQTWRVLRGKEGT